MGLRWAEVACVSVHFLLSSIGQIYPHRVTVTTEELRGGGGASIAFEGLTWTLTVDIDGSNWYWWFTGTSAIHWHVPIVKNFNRHHRNVPQTVRSQNV
jgi:hypothetical protein